MFCYVWEFIVQPGKVEDFRAVYGPEGDWVRLFRRDSGYVRTELLADRSDSARFLTLDYWTSRQACEFFRERYRGEFEALDARCEQLTESETHLGDFETTD